MEEDLDRIRSENLILNEVVSIDPKVVFLCHEGMDTDLRTLAHRAYDYSMSLELKAVPRFPNEQTPIWPAWDSIWGG